MKFPTTLKPPHSDLCRFLFDLSRSPEHRLSSFHGKMKLIPTRRLVFFFVHKAGQVYNCNILVCSTKKGINKPPLSAFTALSHSSFVATYVEGTSKAANRPAHLSIWRLFSASLGLRASDVGGGGPLPGVAADQDSHGRNYMVLAAGFGCGCSVFVTTYHYMLHRERR